MQKQTVLLLSLSLVATASFLFLKKSKPFSNRQISEPATSEATHAVLLDQMLSSNLEELAKTYFEPRVTVSRIRLQSQLSELLYNAEQLPFEQLAEAVASSSHPKEFRLFVSRSIRNAAKRAPDGAFAHKSSELLQQVIGEKEEEETFRAELSISLVDIDNTDRAMSSIYHLIDSIQDDKATAIAIGALVRTDSSTTVDYLSEFVSKNSLLPDAQALSLATALPPLSSIPDYPIEQRIETIVQNTLDYKLLETVLFSLTRRPPSDDADRIRALANERLREFETEEQAILSSLIDYKLRDDS